MSLTASLYFAGFTGFTLGVDDFRPHGSPAPSASESLWTATSESNQERMKQN